MKRNIAILFLFSMILSLISCTTPKDDIFESNDIVLGNEVNSVEITTDDGEKITFDNTADFFDIFNEIEFEFEEGKKYSFDAEMQLQDQPKFYIKSNVYYLDEAVFREFETKRDRDIIAAWGEEYFVEEFSEDSGNVNMSFHRYEYLYEKAFGSMENNKNGTVSHTSNSYPMIPAYDTELGKRHYDFEKFHSVVQYAEFFKHYELENDGTRTIDYNELAKREYKLYENYIVLKQTAPFLSLAALGGYDPQIKYLSVKGADCSVTQEAYYNIKTGEIELIKVYGNTKFHTLEYLQRELKIDMEIYIYDIDKAELQEKVDALIDYVKSNVD